MTEVIAGKVWKFGDSINTDLMLPNVVNQGASTLDEQARMVFSANRPGWVDEMEPGDFMSADAPTASARTGRRRARCATSASPA